ncbi:MAG: transcription termination factor NusA [bacterium]|nr:transcription termination factor NusA [bacterium]
MQGLPRTEFAAALNQVCAERSIDPAIVLDAMKAAILAAFRKDFPDVLAEDEEPDVQIQEKDGAIKIIKDGKNITPAGFGRIAAQTAKQVILQRIREAEKKAIFDEFEGKIGTLMNGMVQRVEGPVVVVDLGKAEGIMPPQEQVRSDGYNPGQRLKFYVVGIRPGPRGNEIIVSRSHKGLVENLFKLEVPEMSFGSVEIKVIAREGGERTKVAVVSNQPGVDPVGSCVGQKGVRVQAVINEVGEEKIDIIQWYEDPIQFITAALSPAKEIVVKIDEENKEADVAAPEDQLSLAIGRGGQNVRLASKLTGYKINIHGFDEM